MNLKYMTLIMSGALVLSACGKDKADATKPYDGIKLAPATGAVAEDQSISGAAFRITQVDSSPTQDTADFSEGEPGILKFKVDSLLKETPHAALVLMPGAPAGMTLTSSPNEPGVYLLQWTAPVGFTQGKLVRYFPASIEARSADPALSNFKLPLALKLSVGKTPVEPKIVNNVIPTTVEEGKNVPFTITVMDPTSGGKTVPVVDLGLCRGPVNVENPKYEGLANVIDLHNVTQSGSAYTYHYEFNTERFPVPQALNSAGKVDAITDGVNLCFSGTAVGAGGNRSTPRPYYIKVMYAARSPNVKFDAATTELVAGQENKITFTVVSGSGRGDVSAVLKNAAVFKSEKNTKTDLSYVASATEPGAKVYTLVYTPSCKLAVPSVIKLDLTVMNKLGSTVRRDSATTNLNVSKTADSCTPAAKPVADVAAAPVEAASASAPKKADTKVSKKKVAKKNLKQPAAPANLGTPQGGV